MAATYQTKSAVLDVYANNDLDLKAKKFVVNSRTSATMDQVIQTLSENLAIVGGVRRLYIVPTGNRVQDVDDLYQANCIVATGKEKLNRQQLRTIGDIKAPATLSSNRNSPKSAGRKGGPRRSNASLEPTHKRDSRSFPGAIHTYKGRKHARVNRSRALQARRSSRHKAYHRQPFAGNPYQVLPPVDKSNENPLTSAENLQKHQMPQDKETNRQIGTSEQTSSSFVSIGQIASLSSPTTPGSPYYIPRYEHHYNQKQNLPDKKVSPTALSNRVDYLLAQVSQVDRRAALERKRQEASVKHKMTQRINQGHDLIQELAEHHEMHHRALDGEAKRQKAVLQLKLQQKEKRENHSMDNNHHDQNLKHEHAEKKDQEQHQTLSAREQQGPEKEIDWEGKPSQKQLHPAELSPAKKEHSPVPVSCRPKASHVLNPNEMEDQENQSVNPTLHGRSQLKRNKQRRQHGQQKQLQSDHLEKPVNKTQHQAKTGSPKPDIGYQNQLLKRLEFQGRLSCSSNATGDDAVADEMDLVERPHVDTQTKKKRERIKKGANNEPTSQIQQRQQHENEQEIEAQKISPRQLGHKKQINSKSKNKDKQQEAQSNKELETDKQEDGTLDVQQSSNDKSAKKIPSTPSNTGKRVCKQQQSKQRHRKDQPEHKIDADRGKKKQQRQNQQPIENLVGSLVSARTANANVTDEPDTSIAKASKKPNNNSISPPVNDINHLKVSDAGHSSDSTKQKVVRPGRVRVLTPDLSVSRSILLRFENDAAIKIQAIYRGYLVRKVCDRTPQFIKAKRQAIADEIERKQREARERHQNTTSQVIISAHGVVNQSYVDQQVVMDNKLGDGNFADVFKCFSREDHSHTYALKTIYKSRLIGKREREMIANEVKIMRALDHPHIIKLFDAFETPTRIYLLLELVEGGDLFDRIVERGRFSELDAKRLIQQLAEAVSYLHERNIVHRDLKPENILVSQELGGRDLLKLGDFGLSMYVEEKIYTICGTPTYVAPEIISEDAVGYGLEVDNWAIGVIAYIMLCGFPPFSSSKRDQKELFGRIRRGAFTFPDPHWEDVSQDAKGLIKNLLRVDPNKRYSAKQILTHRWITDRPKSVYKLQRDRTIPVVEELLKHFPPKDRWSDAVERIQSARASISHKFVDDRN